MSKYLNPILFIIYNTKKPKELRWNPTGGGVGGGGGGVEISKEGCLRCCLMGGSFCFFSFTNLGSNGTGSGSIVTGLGSGSGGLAALISEIWISIFDGVLNFTVFSLGGFIAFKAFRSSTARARAFDS